MKFIPKSGKGFIRVRFVEGTLNTFTGEEMRIGTGQGEKSRRHLPGLRSRLSHKAPPLNRRKLILFLRKVISLAKQNKIKKLDIDFKDICALAPKNISDHDLGALAGEAFVMADYEFVQYKQKPKEGFNFIETVAVRNTSEEGKPGFWKGHQIATEVNETRTLANTPGGDMTPKKLAEAAKKAVKGTKIKVKVLGRKEMRKLGMGAVLGIAQGSMEEPKFIIMEYSRGQTSGNRLCLLAKA